MQRLCMTLLTVLLTNTAPVFALSPGLTDCGPMSGLTPAQFDFAAAAAMMTDEARGRVLGADSDTRGMVNACAHDVRIEICTAKGVMGLVSPSGAAADTVKGAAGGAVLGSLLGFGAVGGATAGASVSGVLGLLESRHALKQCATQREELARIADRLTVSSSLIDPDAGRLSYDAFLSILRENVRSGRISAEEGDELAIAADHWRKALERAVN